MSKYEKFGDYLDRQNEPFSIKFEEIEEILGEKLIPTAYKFQEWWSNSDSHPLMKVVMSKNWKSKNPNLSSKEVEFYKSSESELLKFLKNTMTTHMRSNYMPIVIKMLLESASHSTTVQEIRKKFDVLNFGRGSFVSSGERPLGNDAIRAVRKALKDFTIFPDSTSEGEVKLVEDKFNDSEKQECLKICGQEIAKWHIEKIIGREPTLWRVKPGDEESDWEYHDEFLKTNSIGVGWNVFGDLSEFETEEDANKYMQKITPGFKSKASMTSISHKMSKKDLVVVTKAQQEIVDFGIIVSKYNFEEKGDGSYNHRRQVVWLNQGPMLKKDLPEDTLGGSIGAAHEVRDKSRKELLLNALIGKNTKNRLDMTPRTNHNDPETKKVLKVFENTKNVILYGPPGTGKTRMANIVKDLLLQRNSTNNFQNKENPKIALCFPSKGVDETDDEKIKRHQEYISKFGYMLWGISNISEDRINKNDFPITGYLCAGKKIFAKSRITEIIRTDKLEGKEKEEWIKRNYKVVLKIDDITFCNPFDDIKLERFDNHTELNSQNMSNFAYVKELSNEQNSSNNNFRFVTFHPSFSYEDFLEGIRPVTKNEGKENEAIGYKRQDGIFKEICKSAQNSNEKHLLIIDEINRGNISKIFGELITLIEDDKRGNSLDLAYSKKPFSVPKNLYILGTMNTADKSLVQIDTALRRRFAFVEMMPNSELQEIVDVDGIPIKNLMDKLNEKIREKYRDKQIGHSYFMNISDLEKLHFVFLYKIIPLLQDYFYGDYDELHGVLGDKFISKTKKAIHKKIIDNPEELKNALLSWLGKNDKDKSDPNDNSSE